MTKVALRDAVDVAGGGTPRKSVAGYYGGGIPWVTPKDMKRPLISHSQVTLTHDGVRNSPAKLVPEGSVLVVVRSGVLKHTLPVALTTRPVTVNQDMKALTPRADLDPSYLARLVKSLQPTVLSWVRATTADNFPIDSLLDLKVELPPLREQRRIAAILDHADSLRAKRREVLAHLDSLTQSIFVEFFRQPSEQIAPLGVIAEKVVVGHVGPTRQYFRTTGVPFLRTGNIGNGAVARRDLAYVTAEFHDALRKSQLKSGDVLISRVVTDEVRGAILPADLDGANCANIIVVRPSPDLLAESILGFLGLQSTQRVLLGRRVGSAQGVVNTTVLKDLRTPVYPLREQKRLQAQIQRINFHRHLGQRSLDAEDELFTSLQSRAFRGEP